MVGVDQPDVDAARLGGVTDLRGPTGYPRQHGVEELSVHHVDAGRRQAGRQRACVAVHPARDPGQPVGAVIAGVHGCDHRQQHLRGADIAGGLVAADVLLARLQCQPVGRRTVGIQRHPDQPAGKLAGVLGMHSQITGVWSAESHWHTESLGAAEGDIGTDLAGRGDQCQRQQVGADGDQCTPLVGLRHQLRPVDHRAAGTGQLRDHTEELAVGQTLAQVGGDDLDAQRRGAGRQHGRGLPVHVGVDGQPVGRAASRPVHQRHRLGRGGALVQH